MNDRPRLWEVWAKSERSRPEIAVRLSVADIGAVPLSEVRALEQDLRRRVEGVDIFVSRTLTTEESEARLKAMAALSNIPACPAPDFISGFSREILLPGIYIAAAGVTVAVAKKAVDTITEEVTKAVLHWIRKRKAESKTGASEAAKEVISIPIYGPDGTEISRVIIKRDAES